MSREERRIYSFGIVIAAILIIAIVAVLTDGCGAKIDAYAAPVALVEDFTEESSEAAEKGLFDANSAMPCDDPENFKRWLETYEQETEEEARVEIDFVPDVREDVPQEVPTVQSSEVETSAEVEAETVGDGYTQYSVNGETLNPELAQKLHDALEKYSIGYFWEIALAQCYQESHFNVYAVNPNNLIDSGILQYRATYWDWNRGDIFSVDAQFELYAEQMANRLNAGLSADECISRHKTSDFSTAVDWEYVGQVKQWLSQMEKIK